MKKIFSVVMLIFITLLTSGFTKMHNDEVLEVIQRQVPNDKFYFIRGLEREYGFNTNVRYRGIIYWLKFNFEPFKSRFRWLKKFFGINPYRKQKSALKMILEGLISGK